MARRAAGVTFHWMSDKLIDEIETALSDLPKDSAIFYGIMTRDAAGNFQEYETALERVRHAASAPVFGYSMEQFGRGVVGGSLISMSECGTQAVRIAQRILAGENPADIAPVVVKPGRPTNDWRELETWNIPRSRLPENHLLLYRPPSLWESHRTAVVITLTALILMGAGLLALAEARRRARVSEARLRLTTEAAHVGLSEADGTGAEIVHASPQWRAMFGFSDHEEVTSEKTFRRIHPDDAEMVRNITENAIANGEDFEIEFRILRNDGSTRWIATHGHAEPVTNGHRGPMRGVAIDITGRKHAEAELALRRDEHAHLGRVAALGELSGALAHELNQPLGSIMSNAQTAQRLLAREPADPPALRDILAEDQRAADIIQRLRNLLGRGETRLRPLDGHDCIRKSLSLLQAGLKARGVTVICEFAESPPRVMADPVKIQQVVLNLLGNAADSVTTHPDADCRITIRTSAADGELAVEIADHGGGFTVPPEESFQAFRSTKPGGLGMGLAICRSIIEAHHGKLSAISPPTGGAIVRFTLPTNSSS